MVSVKSNNTGAKAEAKAGAKIDKKVTALILAAGFSKRMGEFKPLLPIGDKSALERLIDSYKQAGVADVFVVTGHNREALLPVIEKSGAVEVFNKDFATGMFSSVKAGIGAVVEKAKKASAEATGEAGGPHGGAGKAATVGKSAGVLLHPVDTPLVNADLIGGFIDAIFEGQIDPAQGRTDLTQSHTRSEMFAVTCFMGKKGHPLYIPEKFFKEILSYAGDGGLKGITSNYDHLMFRYDAGDESVILDMDTREAYQEILGFYDRACDRCRDPDRGWDPGRGLGQAGSEFNNLPEEVGDRRIILVRHGEIRQHKEKIFLGQYDPPLSEKGKDQAKEAGEALLKLGYKLETDRIYTSDLKRASETALIIKGILSSGNENSGIGEAKEGAKIEGLKTEDLKIVEEPGLREMSLGGWDGLFISRIKADFPEAYERRGENLLTFKIDKESENYFDLRYRVWKTLQKILQEDQNKDIIVVSHGGTMRALMSILKGTTLEEEMKIPIKNGEIIVLDSIV